MGSFHLFCVQIMSWYDNYHSNLWEHQSYLHLVLADWQFQLLYFDVYGNVEVLTSANVLWLSHAAAIWIGGITVTHFHSLLVMSLMLLLEQNTTQKNTFIHTHSTLYSWKIAKMMLNPFNQPLSPHLLIWFEHIWPRWLIKGLFWWKDVLAYNHVLKQTICYYSQLSPCVDW